MSAAQTEVITALSHAMRNVRFEGEPDQTYDTRFHAAGDHLHSHVAGAAEENFWSSEKTQVLDIRQPKET